MKDTLYTLTLMRLILAGAAAIWEHEGPKVTAILKHEENHRLLDAMDVIGTALYWVANEVEDTLIPDAQK